jgi:hypothetical protein
MEESRRLVVGTVRTIAGRRITPVAELSLFRHGDAVIGHATLKAVVVQEDGDVYALGLAGEIPLEALLGDIPDLKTRLSQDSLTDPA